MGGILAYNYVSYLYKQMKYSLCLCDRRRKAIYDILVLMIAL